MVRDSSAESEFAVEYSAREDGDAGFLETEQQFLVERIEIRLASIRRMVAEANNVQRNRRKQFESRLRCDEIGEITGLLHVLLDEAGVLVDAMRFQRHPELQSAETAWRFDAAIGKRETARRESANAVAEAILCN